MPPSRSEFLSVHGLRLHLRRWGDAAGPMLLLGHGFLDVSATFAPMVDALLARLQGWQVAAPDWRGFGLSDWTADGYWFHDYVADLDAILAQLQPDGPLHLAGHSMGAQIVSLYAGARPERVRTLTLLDGLTLPGMASAQAPQRLRRWLDQKREAPRERVYSSFDDLADRIRRQHPQLDADAAGFVARCWGQAEADGRIRLCADPKHLRTGPGVYHAEDAEAVWREVRADVLLIDAAQSAFQPTPERRAARDACFPNAVHATIADAGHMLHFDAPVATAERIAAFLAERCPEPACA